MAKLTLADVSTTGDGLRTLINSFNDNMALIESAVENTLSRDGTSPNYMDANLDMNGNRITNLPTAVNNTEPVTLGQAGTILGTTALTQATLGQYLWPQTSAEVTAGVTPTYYYYPPLDVRRYGADDTGGTDSYAAFQAAVDVCGTTGGFVVVPRGTYRLNTTVQVTSERVVFECDPYATINVYGTYGIHFYAASGASPLAGGGVRGGRWLAGDATPTACFYLQNFLRLNFHDLYIYGFYTEPDGAGTRAGVKADYSFGTTYARCVINRCDYAYEIAQDTTLSYRTTSTAWIGGHVSRCRYAIYARDLMGFTISNQMIMENNSVAVYLYGDKTGAGATNCAAGLIDGVYFERNGKHIWIDSNTLARTVGITIQGSFFETVTTVYTSSATAFPDANPGDYKIDIDGDRVTLKDNYFSTAAAVADVIIQAGVVDTHIFRQARAYSTLSDGGTSTRNYTAGILSRDVNEEIAANWKFTASPRMSNDIPLRGLNVAGASYKDLAKVSGSDNAVFGDVTIPIKLFSSAQPDWYDGSTTYHIPTSTATTGGAASAGAGNQYVELNINGTTYKVLHDGTV